MNRGLVSVGVAAWISALALAPVCSADPTGPAPGPAPAPVAGAEPGLQAAGIENPNAPDVLAAPPDSGGALFDACKLFNAAVNLAAANYEDFAYATAGNGNDVNYQDATVQRANAVGRTALRDAAAGALSASNTPGLPPEVADPMRSWSLHATKLLLIMGLHGGGDSLNSNVAQLNTEGHDALMSCATNGWRG
jgi:hypothetical protein